MQLYRSPANMFIFLQPSFFLRFGGCMPLFLHRHSACIFYVLFPHCFICRRSDSSVSEVTWIESSSQIHSLWMGDILIPAYIGLSYRPASLCSLEGRFDNLMPESTISSPIRDYEFDHRTVATLALAVRRSHRSAKSHPDITFRTVLLHKKPGPQR